MQTVLSQIQALEQTLNEEKVKSHRSLLMLSGAYALLIAWTLWDTSRVFHQIKTVSAPETVAAMAASQIGQQLPGLQRDLVTHLQTTSPQLAERIVQSAHRAIPQTGEQIKEKLSVAADQLIARMDERTPELAAFLKANLKETIEAGHYASNEELNKALVSETVGALDRELQQALNPLVFNTFGHLQNQVEQLHGKPYASLTEQQRAEKAALLNALRITELARGEQNSSLLAQGLRAILQVLLPADMFKALDSPVS
ncbi:MAG: hypothetical protein Kow0065_03840 [Methylomicrobium sp.]